MKGNWLLKAPLPPTIRIKDLGGCRSSPTGVFVRRAGKYFTGLATLSSARFTIRLTSSLFCIAPCKPLGQYDQQLLYTRVGTKPHISLVEP